MSDAKILIVEDEVLVARSLETMLRRFGYTSVCSVMKGKDAIARVTEEVPDLILMDIKLRNTIDGIETAEAILRERHIPIIYITAYSDAETVARAKRTEPFAYLTKPINEQELRVNIEMALFKAQADEKLRASEERGRSIIETVGEGIVLQDASGKIIIWNRGAEEIFGMKADEAIGRTSIDYPWPTIREDGSPFPGSEHPSMHTLRTGEPCRNVIMGLQRADGARRWILINTNPIINSGDKPSAVVIAFRDITELKQAQDALQESKERHALALLGADLGTWDWHIPTGRVVFNERWAAMLGYSLDEIGPDVQTWESLVHPDDRPYVMQVLQAHLEGRSDFYETEHRLRHKTGKWVWVLDKGRVIVRDAAGRPVRACGTHLDITERKQAEAIYAARLRLRELAVSCSMEELLRATIDECEALTESSVGFYHFIESDQQTVSLQAWSTNTTKNMCRATGAGLHYPVRDAGVWVDCIHEKKPVIHNDYASLPHRKGMPDGHVPVTRELLVPVLRKGLVVAVLGVGNKQALYDDHDVTVVATMADLAWDIAERKRLEESLTHAERVLRTLINASQDTAILFDAEHRIIALNIVAAGQYNKTIEDMIGRDGLAPFPPQVAARRKAMLDRVMETGEPIRVEDEREGHILDNYFVPIKDHDGKVCQIALFARDVTEERKTAQMLEQNESRYRAMFEGTFNAIAVYQAVRDGEDFVFLDFNAAAERIEQITRDRVIGKSVLEVFPGVREFGLFEVFQRVWRTGSAEHFPIGRYKDNRIVEWRDNYVYKLPTGEVVAIYRDETARKQAEENLQRNMTAIEQAHEAIVVADPAGVIEYVNPAFERITGYLRQEAIGQNPRILKSGAHDDRFYADLWQTITAGRTWQGHFVNRRKDGALYDEEAVISPVKNQRGDIVNFVAVKRDVTSELRLEEQLRQAQKMEAIGTLAGGIAHDFNNILAGILNYAQIGLDDLDDRESVRESFTWIMKLGDRAADMVRQILAFSRQTGREKHPVRLQSIVKEAIKLLRSTIPANIELHSSIDGEAGAVLADLTQMHQILINLCSNAASAMLQKGGRIDITLAAYALREPNPDFPTLQPGDYVRLSVSDTGPGIEPELQQRIFEPYFTTKKPGEGIGMGLAVVHGIVTDHRGAIAVQSAPGKGSTFTVLLPCAADSAPEPAQDGYGIPGGNEHILLVDDEQAIIDSISMMLKKLGYTVTACGSAREALRVFQRDPAAFQLVLTDQTMPETTGNLLAQEMRRLRPDLPVILMTGYSAIVDPATVSAWGIKKILMKPVHHDVLAREIRKAIEE